MKWLKPSEIPAPGTLDDHDFTLTRDVWELAVFDNAVLFTVITIRGRGTREREEFDNPSAAFAREQNKPRSCVYAVSRRGRFIMLPPSRYSFYEQRWAALHTKIHRRPVRDST